MWQRVLAVNSFLIVPAAFIYAVYSLSRLVFFLEWKPFLLAAILLAIAMAMNAVIATLCD